MPSTNPNYSKEHYLANKERYLENQRKRRARKRKWLDDIKKASKCKYCPENTPCCLDFHHITSDKIGEVSQLIRDTTKEIVMHEINKCEIVCANCHRKIHAGIINQ